MLFRNLTLFRFVPDAGLAVALDGALPAHTLKPVAPLTMASRGWVSPYGRDSDVLSHALGNYRLLVLGGEDRLLPPAVVNEAVALKVAALAADRGRPPGARDRKRLREDVLHDLMPRAFVRPSRLAGYLDLKLGWLAIDTASRKTAEAFVATLRETLGSFAAVPLDPGESPRASMTAWLREADLPKSWQLGEECELKDPVDRGAVVKCRRQDLAADEVREHLKSGKQATMLEFAFDDHVVFVLDELLVLRKLRFLDAVTAELEGADRDSVAAEIDARFAVMALTLAPLFEALERVFKLAAADAQELMPSRLRQFAKPQPDRPQAADDHVIAWRGDDGSAHQVAVRRHPQSRRLRLIVDDAGARVVAPLRASVVSIERFVVEHRRWIVRQIERHSIAPTAPPVAGVDDFLSLRGVQTPVRWCDRRLPRIERADDGAILIGVPLDSPKAAAIAARVLRTWLIAEATRDIARCNDAALLRIDARASRVSVRPLRTLWGSISVDGSMRIDLALLLAPPEILDYVVVHEACHMHERNHGPRFWAHVARAHPDYRDHRRWLRAHGPALKSHLGRWLDAR